MGFIASFKEGVYSNTVLCIALSLRPSTVQRKKPMSPEEVVREELVNCCAFYLLIPECIRLHVRLLVARVLLY